jgi:hypothetical protein
MRVSPRLFLLRFPIWLREGHEAHTDLPPFERLTPVNSGNYLVTAQRSMRFSRAALDNAVRLLD